MTRREFLMIPLLDISGPARRRSLVGQYVTYVSMVADGLEDWESGIVEKECGEWLYVRRRNRLSGILRSQLR